MRTIFNKTVLTVLTLFISTMALAQDDPSRMTYDMAAKAMEAAEAYARQQGWNVTILVADQNANPVMVRRLDGASPRTFTIATSKALVVTKTGLTSGEYGAKLQAGEIEEIVAGTGYLPRTVIGVGIFLLDNHGEIELLMPKQLVTFERFLKPLLEADKA